MRNKLGYIIGFIFLFIAIGIFILGAVRKHRQDSEFKFNPIIEHSEIPSIDTNEVYNQIHEIAERHKSTLIDGLNCRVRALLYANKGDGKRAKKSEDSVENYWMPLDKAERDSARELEEQIGIGKPKIKDLKTD